MKQTIFRNIILGMLVVVLISGFLFRSNIGWMVWDQTRWAEGATFFVQDDAWLLVTIGNHYFNVDNEGVYDLKEAQLYFEKALEKNQFVPDAWHQLARIDFLNGDFNDAVYKINKQIEIHEDSFMAAYYIRGLIYGYMKDYSEAEQDFITFLEWDPNNWAANNDLAWIYFSKGDYVKTLGAAEKGLEVDSDNPWVLNMYGLSLINLERFEEAVPILEKALIEAQKLTIDDWHNAYPGNHPDVAETGLKEMVKSIEFNRDLAVSK